MIFVAHGVVDAADEFGYLGRYMLDRGRFQSRLRARANPFVGLEAAAYGDGDALTVDDATVAAAQMAMSARELGHEATLFVNPGQIVSGQAYWFHRLTLLVDGLGSRVEFNEEEFDCSTIAEKVRLRRALKGHLLSIRGESERLTALSEIRMNLQARPTRLPDHLRTLTVRELEALSSAGVRLANHGWHHPHYDYLSSDERLAEIRKGRDWLDDFQSGSGEGVFACPFGDHVPDRDLVDFTGLWLSADNRAPLGFRKGIYNRQEIRF